MRHAQPIVLAYDLLAQPRRQRAPVAGAHVLKAGDEARLERHHVTNALAKQQRLDAIGVRGLLLQQPLALAAAALAVLVFRRGHVQHAADPRLAAQIGEEGPHQLLQVDAIGLGAPPAPADLDAGGINDVARHPLIRQPAVQPVPVEPGFVA